MFFRRKPVTLASLDERLSVVETALQIRREEASEVPTSPLEAALARLQRAIASESRQARM